MGDAAAATLARVVFAPIKALQRLADLAQFLAPFRVERLEDFAILQFRRLLGEVLGDRRVPVVDVLVDRPHAFVQLDATRQQALSDMLDVDGTHGSPSSRGQDRR